MVSCIIEGYFKKGKRKTQLEYRESKREGWLSAKVPYRFNLVRFSIMACQLVENLRYNVKTRSLVIQN